MDKNTTKALNIILKELRENRRFGSMFQFWVTQANSILEDELINTGLTNDEIYDIAIKVVRNISQESCN